MFLEYLYHLSTISIIELFLLCIIVYNFFKISTTESSLFLLGYFFFFVFFAGILFIFLDIDLFAIILWIIYFGLLLIFLLLALVTKEVHSTNLKLYKNVIFFSLILFFFVNNNLVHFIMDEFTYINLFSWGTNYSAEELELLGFSFIYWALPYLLISSYILFFNCLVVVYLYLFFKLGLLYQNLSNKTPFHLSNWKNWVVYKNQVFFSQNWELTNQHFSFIKNYKVSHRLHQLKTTKRRI